jgi:hypothetical protein
VGFVATKKLENLHPYLYIFNEPYKDTRLLTERMYNHSTIYIKKRSSRKTGLPDYIQVNHQLALLNGHEFRKPERSNMNVIKSLLAAELMPQWPHTRLNGYFLQPEAHNINGYFLQSVLALG